MLLLWAGDHNDVHTPEEQHLKAAWLLRNS